MRELFFKLLPYAVGILIGLFLAFPPAAFDAFGIWKPVVLALLLAVLVLTATGLQIAAGFPRHPRIEPVPVEQPEAEARLLLDAYRSLGFEPAEVPLRLDLRPTSTLWVLRHRDLSCWVSVFTTGTVPRRHGHGVGSVIEGRRGGLDTVPDWKMAVLPRPPGQFKQVFPGSGPAELLDHHRRAMRYLEERGLVFERPIAAGIPDRIREELQAQRETVLANPLKAAILLLFRVLRKSTPYLGSIEDQKRTARDIAHVLGGGEGVRQPELT